MSDFETVINGRYKAPVLSKIWSPENRVKTMRSLWLNLAIVQKELGVKSISDDALRELEENKDTIDFSRIAAIEKECKHDIFAHIKAYAELCPNGGKIIHLGATSNYINDNADSILIKNSFVFIEQKLDSLILSMKANCNKYSDIPTIAYTHLQPAQLITIGKRFSMWLQDFKMDRNLLKQIVIPFRGIKGTVGTEDTLMKLFDDDIQKCDKLNERLKSIYGFEKNIKVCGQTYSRKYDVEYIHLLSSICQSIYKLMNDIRLLSGKKEVFEEFTEKQVGSSAMPYKKNPIQCEKICSLCRYVINQELNINQTYINQWLERSLDDSAIKRILFPECFLLVEYILEQTIHIIDNLHFNIDWIHNEVQKHMMNVISEELIISGVEKGMNRQDLHERLRIILTSNNPCIENIYKDCVLRGLLKEVSHYNPLNYIGRSIEQSNIDN